MQEEVNDGYQAVAVADDSATNRWREVEFIGFPKVPRFSRTITITEKIDGTNGQICITEEGEMFVGSRNRWITPAQDNHGFARWCHEHKDELMKLGVGRHYGEWWGSGIQRGYGLKAGEKRFSLFNVSKWRTAEPVGEVWENEQEIVPACCSVVPILYRGPFDMDAIHAHIKWLERNGSLASPGFMQPEGIMIYHEAGRHLYKKTILNDEFHKGEPA